MFGVKKTNFLERVWGLGSLPLLPSGLTVSQLARSSRHSPHEALGEFSVFYKAGVANCSFTGVGCETTVGLE